MSRPRGVSLERTAGYIGLFCSILIIAAIIGLSIKERGRLYRDASDGAQTAAFFLADHASRLFEASDLLLTETTGAIAGLSWDEITASRPLWEQLRALGKRLPYIDAIWLNDAAGDLRFSTVAYPSPRANAADRDFFIGARGDDSRIFISEIIKGRVTGRSTFLLTRRLSNTDGSFRGIVSVTADLAYFDDFYGSLKLPFEPSIRLFRSADMGILASHPPASGQRIAFAESFVGAVARNMEAGMIRDANMAPGDARVAYHRIRDLPVYVGVVALKANLDKAWMGQLRIYGILGGAALLALASLTLFAFRQARQVTATQELLESRVTRRTADLAAANAEMNTLFQEVHHRVKNNLQVVTSLLRLQQMRVEAPPARAALQDSIDRIQAMGLVHQLLYSTQELSQVDFSAYVARLAAQLVGAYGVSDRISVEVTGAPLRFSLDTAIPLALIVNEVVSNALKHAYPDGCDGRIVIDLQQVEDENVLSLQDDGIGFPAGIELGDAQSLGLRIVRSLSAQLGGTPTIVGDGGTRFTLRFPVEQP